MAPAPRITRTRLPGIGERTEVHNAEGDSVSVVQYPGGAVDLQVADTPPVRLAEADARALGAVLTGTFTIDPSLLEELHSVLGGLQIDAVRIHRDGAMAGRTIGDLEIRRRHRVTVAAVLHGSLPDVSPGPDTVLDAGARVLVLGQPPDVVEFRRAAGGRDGS